MQNPESKVQTKASKILLMVGILCIAINLRWVLTSVGLLIDDTRLDTILLSSFLGLLTTLPLISFGIISTLSFALSPPFIKYNSLEIDSTSTTVLMSSSVIFIQYILSCSSSK